MPGYIRDLVLVRELERGRWGRRFRAEGEVRGVDGRPVGGPFTVTVLPEEVPHVALTTLDREWPHLSALAHPSIARPVAWWPEDRSLVAEHVTGATLRMVLDACRARREQIYTEAVLDLGCELADALHHASSSPGPRGEPLDVSHLDLRPETILLTPSGGVRLLDYGLAVVRPPGHAVERALAAAGEPVYLAPEQVRGEAGRHRTDLFALGAVLFELLIGRPLWSTADDPGNADADALFARIGAGATEDAQREIEAMVPGAGTIVARLLQANPAARHSSGQELLAVLRRQIPRDRGSGLAEFAGFYFGTIAPPAPEPEPPAFPPVTAHQEPPMAQPPGPTGPRPPAAEPGDGSVPRAVPVRRPGRNVPLAQPTSAPVAPADAAPRPGPRIVQRPTPTRAELEQEDLPPSVRNSTGGGPRQRVVGARRPDETGMLPVLPLTGAAGGGEGGADPSATAFFAIPAPKAARPGVTSSPAGAPASGVGAFQPPPVPTGPVASGPVASGPVASGPAAGVAGYGGASAAATPFAVSGPAPTASTSAETRVQSQRVWAVVLGVMFLGGMAVLLVVGIVLYNQFVAGSGTVQPPVTAVTTTPAVVEPEPDPEPDPVVPATTRKPTTRPTTTTSTRPTTTTTPTAAPAAQATGTLSVTFTGANLPTSATLTCGDDKRRNNVTAGKVSFANVPTGDDCTLRPSSALTFSPARGLRGGKSYTCDVTDFNTTCR